MYNLAGQRAGQRGVLPGRPVARNKSGAGGDLLLGRELEVCRRSAISADGRYGRPRCESGGAKEPNRAH